MLNEVEMHTDPLRRVLAMQEQPEAAKEETVPVVAVPLSVRMVETVVPAEIMEKGVIRVMTTKVSKLEEMDATEETELLAVRQEI